MTWPVTSEAVCLAFTQIFLRGAGFYAVPEAPNARGRSDLEFDAGVVHWVLELKFMRKTV